MMKKLDHIFKWSNNFANDKTQYLFGSFQVSYMIVDDADVEIEMSADPFLEAGITAPPILPYKVWPIILIWLSDCLIEMLRKFFCEIQILLRRTWGLWM